MLIRKPYLMIFWFLPILVAMSTLSIKEAGLGGYISYVQLLLVVLGLLYLFMQSTAINFSVRVFLVLFLLALNILISDIREYQLVVFLVGYTLVTHMVVKKHPHEIWSQYYFICLVIAGLTMIDFVSFFTLGDYLVSSRAPVLIDSGLPRISTIFDEMSHQAFFLMPAAIFALVHNTKYRYWLLLSLLLTMSVAALLLFSLAVVIYLRKKLLRNLFSLAPLFVIVGFALFLGREFITDKVIQIFVYDDLISGQQTKKISAANILLGLEVLKEIPLTDLFFGYGYFGLEENLPRLIHGSKLYPYFESTEMLQDPQSVGVLNLVLYFGLIQCCLMAAVLYAAKKYVNDVWLYNLAIFVVFLSLLKNSNTIDYLVHMFFMFGLSWASTHSLSNKRNDRYPKTIGS